ncbi:MAG TPA: hypothetical protein VGF14_01900 [Alphaproteobacteria bacterium]
MSTGQEENNWHNDAVAARLSDYPVSRLRQTYLPDGWYQSTIRNFQTGSLRKLFPDVKKEIHGVLNMTMQDVLLSWYNLTDKPKHLKDLPYEEAIAKYLKIPRIDGKMIGKIAYDPRIRIDPRLAGELDRLLKTEGRFVACATRSSPDKPRPKNIVTLPFTLDPYDYKGRTASHGEILRDIFRTWKTGPREFARYLRFKKTMADKFSYVLASEEEAELFERETTPPEYLQDEDEDNDFDFNDKYDDYWDDYEDEPEFAAEIIKTTPVLGGEINAVLDRHVFSGQDAPFSRYTIAARDKSYQQTRFLALDPKERFKKSPAPKLFPLDPEAGNDRAVYVTVNPVRDDFYRDLAVATDNMITNPETLQKKLVATKRHLCEGWDYDHAKRKDMILFYLLKFEIKNPVETLRDNMGRFLKSIPHFGEKPALKTDHDYISFGDLERTYDIVKTEQDWSLIKEKQFSKQDYFYHKMNEMVHNDIEGVEYKYKRKFNTPKASQDLMIDRAYLEQWLENGQMAEGKIKTRSWPRFPKPVPSFADDDFAF